jgi:hypothetical protein
VGGFRGGRPGNEPEGVVCSSVRLMAHEWLGSPLRGCLSETLMVVCVCDR